VSERLSGGHYTRVSQATSQLNRRLGAKHKKLKDRLVKLAQAKEIV
jgi:hypothetical protein